MCVCSAAAQSTFSFRFPGKKHQEIISDEKIIMALNPIESGEFIVKNAKYLEVKDFGIKNLANQVKIIC